MQLAKARANAARGALEQAKQQAEAAEMRQNRAIQKKQTSLVKIEQLQERIGKAPAAAAQTAIAIPVTPSCFSVSLSLCASLRVFLFFSYAYSQKPCGNRDWNSSVRKPSTMRKLKRKRSAT